MAGCLESPGLAVTINMAMWGGDIPPGGVGDLHVQRFPKGREKRSFLSFLIARSPHARQFRSPPSLPHEISELRPYLTRLWLSLTASLLASAGNLYGVTPHGGAYGRGIVFEIIP